MEQIYWFGINKKDRIVSLQSVDALCVINYLKDEDFQIIELICFNKHNDEKIVVDKKNKRPFSLKKDKYEIKFLLETDEKTPISCLEIKLRNNDFIIFQYGSLSVKMKNFEKLKKVTVKILDFYGYYSAYKIWDFALDHKEILYISIAHLLEEKDISDHFDLMLEHNKRIKNYFN